MTDSAVYPPISPQIAERRKQARARYPRRVPSNSMCTRTRSAYLETDIRMKIGLSKAGKITGVECDCIQRGGAHRAMGW